MKVAGFKITQGENLTNEVPKKEWEITGDFDFQKSDDLKKFIEEIEIAFELYVTEPVEVSIIEIPSLIQLIQDFKSSGEMIVVEGTQKCDYEAMRIVFDDDIKTTPR